MGRGRRRSEYYSFAVTVSRPAADRGWDKAWPKILAAMALANVIVFVPGLLWLGTFFQLVLFVSGGGGMPCKLCGTPLREVKLGQRASVFCPRCQR